MNTEKLWTKDFVTVSVINFLVFLTHFLLMVTIASYAVDEFHATTDVAGLVAGIFIIGALIGRLGTGRFLEHVGSKNVLLVSVAFFIVTSALYFAAVNLPLLIIIRLCHGMCFGAASTATGTMVAQIIPPGRHGEGIGYYSIGAILSVALGPFIGMFLIQHSAFKMIFAVTTILAAGAFALSFIQGKPVRQVSEEDSDRAFAGFRMSRFFEVRAIPISIVIFVVGFCYSGVLAFVSLYIQEIHLEEAAKYYFLIYAVAVFISRPFSGRFFDTRGPNFVAYPCLIIYAVGMLLFSQANGGLILLLAGVVFGLGYGNFFSSAQAMSIRKIPPHRLGLATSTFFIFVDLGFGIGPYVLGLLVPLTGYRGLYLLLTVLILATLPLYWALYGKKNPSGRRRASG